MAERGMPCGDGRKARTVLGEIAYPGLIAVLICVTALGLGCQKKAAPTKAEKMSNVKVWTIAQQSVQPYVEAIGSLKPNDEVIISPEVDGILKALRVDEGSAVTAGMVLAEVKDTDYRLAVDQAQAALRQAEASLANTKLEYQRKEALLKEDLVTKQQFDDVSTRLTIATQDLDRAKAGLSLTRERLGKTIIRSPLTGVVRQKMVTAGDFVRASAPILAIIQNDPLKLNFSVSEKDIGALKPGQDVVFTVDSFPSRAFTGKLNILYPSLDERSRTLQVEALVPNADRLLRPGLFARVKVYIAAPRQAVVVPITAILYEGTRIRAFVLEGDKARERSLKVGDKYGEVLEVQDGVRAGEQLIVVGQNQLVDGTKVHVVR